MDQLVRDFVFTNPANSRAATPLLATSAQPVLAPPPPSPRAKGGSPTRFRNVLKACMQNATPTHHIPSGAPASEPSSVIKSIATPASLSNPLPSESTAPTAHKSLQEVTLDDLHAYRSTQFTENQAIEERMADVFRGLYDRHSYRHVGLFMALLLQGIDLTQESYGPITQGRAGVVANRLAAVVRQSMSARDARAKNNWSLPVWAIILVSVLGFLLVIAIAVIVWVMLRSSK